MTGVSLAAGACATIIKTMTIIPTSIAGRTRAS
jgi:hypothetical protein